MPYARAAAVIACAAFRHASAMILATLYARRRRRLRLRLRCCAITPRLRH